MGRPAKRIQFAYSEWFYEKYIAPIDELQPIDKYGRLQALFEKMEVAYHEKVNLKPIEELRLQRAQLEIDAMNIKNAMERVDSELEIEEQRLREERAEENEAQRRAERLKEFNRRQDELVSKFSFRLHTTSAEQYKLVRDEMNRQINTLKEEYADVVKVNT